MFGLAAVLGVEQSGFVWKERTNSHQKPNDFSPDFFVPRKLGSACSSAENKADKDVQSPLLTKEAKPETKPIPDTLPLTEAPGYAKPNPHSLTSNSPSILDMNPDAKPIPDTLLPIQCVLDSQILYIRERHYFDPSETLEELTAQAAECDRRHEDQLRAIEEDISAVSREVEKVEVQLAKWESVLPTLEAELEKARGSAEKAPLEYSRNNFCNEIKKAERYIFYLEEELRQHQKKFSEKQESKKYKSEEYWKPRLDLREAISCTEERFQSERIKVLRNIFKSIFDLDFSKEILRLISEFMGAGEKTFLLDSLDISYPKHWEKC